MIWLSISIIALALGVLVSNHLEQNPTWNSTLHGFVTGFIGLLLFIEILPHSREHIGYASWIWFGLGFLLITGMDYFSSTKKEWLSIGLLSLVFGLHALVDGVALGTQKDGTLLAIAIVAHRFPEGLAIAGKATNTSSKWILLSVMIAASILGYFSVQTAHLESLSILQSLAGGGLAHVLLHGQFHAHDDHDHKECTTLDLRGWRIGGFITSVAAYLLIHFVHAGQASTHTAHVHTHDTNFSLMVLVGMALFALVWWEQEHSHT